MIWDEHIRTQYGQDHASLTTHKQTPPQETTDVELSLKGAAKICREKRKEKSRPTTRNGRLPWAVQSADLTEPSQERLGVIKE